jgi:hypothetical protein
MLVHKFNLAVIAIIFLFFGLACSFKTEESSQSKPDSRKNNEAKTEKVEKKERKKERKNESEEAALKENEEPNYSQKDDYKLEIIRSFPSLEKPEGPPRHGDYSYFKHLESGGTAGSLYLTKPREAIFIIWDGEAIAGPLTTIEEVEETFAMLSKQSAEEHQLRMDIMKNRPAGGNRRVKVYDSNGNLIREEDNP